MLFQIRSSSHLHYKFLREAATCENLRNSILDRHSSKALGENKQLMNQANGLTVQAWADKISFKQILANQNFTNQA